MGNTNNPGGVSREYKRAIKSLASSIREGVSVESIRDWLVQVWQGKDPLTGEKVDIRIRRDALQMLMNRGWGQDAQFLVIEAQVKLEQTSILQDFKGQDPKQLIARRDKLLADGIKRKIIDVVNAPVPTNGGYDNDV